MDDNGTLILSLIALVAMSAFFSASETAYTSVNRARLKAMANGGNRRAAKVLALSEDYDRLLSGILVGNNIVNILSASLATVLFVRLIGGAGVSVSTAVMTVVVLMFGEIAPKTIAKDRPEQVALAVYPLLSVILVLLTPIIFLTTCWQKLIYKLIPPSKDRGINEEELITIVEEAENEGEIDAHEGELIRSAIEFNDMTAEDILTPRVDVVSAEVNSTPEEVARIFEQSGRSRIPVYEDSIDNIVGILHEKDFYRLRGKVPLKEMMSEPLCVVPSTQLAVLLKLLQRTKNHMAVVVDEYGGVVGIVTMEDILEELVGEIWDEHDEVVEDIVQLSDDEWRVSGGASLDDLRQRLPIGDDFESVTVNGWVLEVLGHLPQPGDTFDYRDLHVTVERVAPRRVEQIRIHRNQADEA
ncbi:MAG: HlyC/CorC family transporter [Clostridia bacterium]|nr:HlyC/CorC family transporter [Clostridia bacterium]MBR3274397.1 HlyC/CorC family transporter [Clostridia bacterium]